MTSAAFLFPSIARATSLLAGGRARPRGGAPRGNSSGRVGKAPQAEDAMWYHQARAMLELTRHIPPGECGHLPSHGQWEEELQRWYEVGGEGLARFVRGLQEECYGRATGPRSPC